MVELPEQWWIEVQAQLSDLLETLDERSEPLIAAHVATAIDSLNERVRQLRAGQP